jgi:tetratricopeptide (TPR) repeat protein
MLSLPHVQLELLRKAEKFARIATTLTNVDSSGELWISSQEDLGSVLRSLGVVMGGKEGEALIRESLMILTEALKRTEAQQCSCMLELQIEKINSLHDLSQELHNAESNILLQEAIQMSEAAIKSLQGVQRSREFATLHFLLGRSLRQYSENLGGKGSSGLFYFRNPLRDKQALPMLERSVIAIKAALNATNYDERPSDWRLMKIELGDSLTDLGEIFQWEGVGYFRDAVENYQAALAGLTKEMNPAIWADVQLALARVFESLAGYSRSDKDEQFFFDQAIGSTERALTVYVRSTDPNNRVWAEIQLRLGEILCNYGLMLSISDNGRDKTNEILERAISLFTETFEVFDRLQSPVEWALACSGIGRARSLLGQQIIGEEGNKLIRQGIDDLQKALSVFTKTTHPKQWCACQNRLLKAQKDLWFRGDKAHSKWSGIAILVCE